MTAAAWLVSIFFAAVVLVVVLVSYGVLYWAFRKQSGPDDN
jgi:cbb3-type cytochrome oxidase subunit 3